MFNETHKYMLSHAYKDQKGLKAFRTFGEKKKTNMSSDVFKHASLGISARWHHFIYF